MLLCRYRFFLLVLCLGLVSWLTPVAVGFSASLPLGMWAECQNHNRTLNSPERLQAMLERAQAAGIGDVFLQVFRGGRSWYPSRLADMHPGIKKDFDPLKFALTEAHTRGIKIHAWVNCFNLSLNPDAAIFRNLGYQILIADNRGNSALVYLPALVRSGFLKRGSRPAEFYAQAKTAAHFDTNGLWVDPAEPKVQAYLLEVLAELARNYPELDGIHLDYIRYPFAVPAEQKVWTRPTVDFGFNELSRRAFAAETGLIAPFRGEHRENAERFKIWRRDRLSAFVTQAGARIKKEHATLKFSAAVIADTAKAYNSTLQDWPNWVKTGTLDWAVVMNYNADAKLSGALSRQSTAVRDDKGKVYIGLNTAVLLDDFKNLKSQVAQAAGAQADGVVFFSYDNMIRKPEIFKFIKENF